MSKILTKENCILELPEIQYNKSELVRIYNEIKEQSRVKYLPWEKTPAEYRNSENSKSTVIQFDDHQIRNPANQNKGINLFDYEYIKQLADYFNIDHKIHPANITMLIYKKDFVFKPHTDGYAKSIIIFPILMEFTQTIQFYQQDNIKMNYPGEYPNISAADILYEHLYNESCPTIFNGHAIHGVNSTLGYHVKLKINVNEDFDSLCKKHQNGTLLKF